MIVIKNNFIPFGSYTAMNLFGIVFTKEEANEKMLNHEKIHSVQIIEMAIVAAIIITAKIKISFSFFYQFFIFTNLS